MSAGSVLAVKDSSTVTPGAVYERELESPVVGSLIDHRHLRSWSNIYHPTEEKYIQKTAEMSGFALEQITKRVDFCSN